MFVELEHIAIRKYANILGIPTYLPQNRMMIIFV